MAKLLTASAGKVMAMAAALDEMAMSGARAVSTPFFSPDEVGLLIKHCLKLPMRTAKARTGAEGREVVQDFDICFPAPRDGAMAKLADMLEAVVDEAMAKTARPYLSAPLVLNDVAVQHYHPKSKGIGVHRDALRYRGLVFIITLAGESQLSICDDRDGNGATIIDDQPGRIAVLSAAGFDGREGEDARALHKVDAVTAGRLSIGLRHDSKI